MRRLALIIAGALISAQALATTWFVQAGGSDANPGTQAQPFATFAQAQTVMSVGDTAQELPGTLALSQWPITIGSSSAVTTFQGCASTGPGTTANPGGQGTCSPTDPYCPGVAPLYLSPCILAPGGNTQAIYISTGSYLKIAGFQITESLATNGNYAIQGVSPGGHVTITNNYVHDASGGGIGISKGDYESIYYNYVYHTGYNSTPFPSGISIGYFRPTDTVPGVHHYIGYNISEGNIDYWDGSTQTTDGNGIIVDSSNVCNSNYPDRPASCTAASVTIVNSQYPAVVEGNVVFGNGGAGIKAYASSSVIIRNNTAFGDFQDPHYKNSAGEISLITCYNCSAYNNVAEVYSPYPTGNNYYAFEVVGSAGHVDNFFDWVAFNLSLATAGAGDQFTQYATGFSFDASNITNTNPGFVSPITASGYASSASVLAGFSLSAGSKAINAGTANGAATNALLVPWTGNPNMGAL